MNRRTLFRRTFCGSTAFGLGYGALGVIGRCRGATARSAESNLVALDPSIEPLVRLLETTPRDRVLEEVGTRIRQGAGYADILGALLLAGAREVQPRPSVGFKFHAVLGVISYHLIGRELPKRDQWLPVFWGIDYFKSAQQSDAREGDWKMSAVDEAAVPPAAEAAAALVEAMEQWNEPAADAAVAAVARHLPPQEVFELFYGLGARDFRSIGHKAIFVMGAQRVLEQIGWQHAEPVLRSLAYALLMHEDGNPADRNDVADRPWRRNQKIVAKLRPHWRDGAPSREATVELLAVLRNGSYEDAADAVIDRLNAGASPQSVWDAIFCGAAELQLRQPNIVSLHAATTTRAIHYAYRTTAMDETRRLLLLQNASLLPMFRDAAGARGKLREAAVDGLEPVPPQGSDEAAIRDIFATMAGGRHDAVRKILGYLESGRPAGPLLDQTRELLAHKAGGVHDYKFTSSCLEDFHHVSEPWKNRYLACGAMHFCPLEDQDNPLVQRTRLALGG